MNSYIMKAVHYNNKLLCKFYGIMNDLIETLIIFANNSGNLSELLIVSNNN